MILFFSGKRVVGMATSAALSTLIAADKSLLVEIPKHWSMEEAVTVPVVYSTVLYAFLVVRSTNKKKNEKLK